MILEKVPFIKESLSAWQDLFMQKIEPFIDGNQYLKELPMHQNPDMFYIMVKELNPLHLILKHPYTEIQAQAQALRSTGELIAFDEGDPITARRMLDAKDRLNAPGSTLFILSGHHRLYEIYKRYLKGKIEGDTLIEAVKGSY